MDPPDSDTDCPGPYDTAFETFYEKMDDWAKCLAKLKPDDAARLRAAAAGLTAIIASPLMGKLGGHWRRCCVSMTTLVGQRWQARMCTSNIDIATCTPSISLTSLQNS